MAGRPADSRADHAVGEQPMADVVRCGGWVQDVVDAREFGQRQVADAGAGVDGVIVVEQERGGALPAQWLRNSRARGSACRGAGDAAGTADEPGPTRGLDEVIDGAGGAEWTGIGNRPGRSWCRAVATGAPRTVLGRRALVRNRTGRRDLRPPPAAKPHRRQ